ncbi:hypothetical protein OG384_04440 [Streptomyces sp. NBC_01324]|uniref:hypothetical protein n=1 Tax=Streptomyces sp. NBC_01324 TaxID=2903826 RepID=UPI002E15F9CB|nr:hypothetical protein OG384_04440 [Streptomyces sp. NBC_01324]
MAGSRHFFRNQPAEQTRAEIKDDIAASRGAQRDLQANGQHRLAETMRQNTDERLDELNQLDNGTWTPNHA